jgi:AcrR family transcriptional regulator
MGITERKEKEKQEMQRLILDTAKKLFLEQGFEKVTIRSIAQKIEYSPATIYLYFKDKDQILFQLHEDGFNELYKRQQSISGIANTLERLRRHAQIYLQFAVENPEYYDLMFIMRAPAKCIKDEKAWTIGMRSYEVLHKDVTECMDSGLMKKADPMTVTFALWASMHGIASLMIRDRCVVFPEEMLPAMIQGAEQIIMNCFSKTTP